MKPGDITITHFRRNWPYLPHKLRDQLAAAVGASAEEQTPAANSLIAMGMAIAYRDSGRLSTDAFIFGAALARHAYKNEDLAITLRRYHDNDTVDAEHVFKKAPAQ